MARAGAFTLGKQLKRGCYKRGFVSWQLRELAVDYHVVPFGAESLKYMGAAVP